MDKKVIRHFFILNDIETEGASLLPKILAGKFPVKGDEFVHVLRLDGDVRQYAVHCNLLI
jgi:hypothetical protein